MFSGAEGSGCIYPDSWTVDDIEEYMEHNPEKFDNETQLNANFGLDPSRTAVFDGNGFPAGHLEDFIHDGDIPEQYHVTGFEDGGFYKVEIPGMEGETLMLSNGQVYFDDMHFNPENTPSEAKQNLSPEPEQEPAQPQDALSPSL